MRTPFAILVVALFMAAAVPAGGSQTPAQPVLVFLTDLLPDGYTYVGALNQFGYVLLTDDGRTQVHRDGKIRIFQNGVKLYETGGMAAAHDYDALNPFLYAFQFPGPFRVETEVPVSGSTLATSFEGVVMAPLNASEAKVHLAARSVGGLSYEFTIHLSNAQTDLIPHSDAILEIRRASDNWLVFRTHTHTHDQKQVVSYVFPRPGDYVVRVIGYDAFPTPRGAQFPPVAVSQAVSVRAEAPVATAPAPASTPADPSSAPNLRLLTTTDPAPSATCGGGTCIGPFGNVRLNALVFDLDAKQAVQHVDYEATLVDPAGRTVFASKTLHEYDGNLEVVTSHDVPGEYVLRVKAIYDEWSSNAEVKFRVVPPAFPINGAGPIIVKAAGLAGPLKSGTPYSVVLSTEMVAALQAHRHAEIDLQVIPGSDRNGPPILSNKLHTHGDGKFPFEIVFPVPGTYHFLLDAQSLGGEPSPVVYYDAVGQRPILAVTVAEGPPLPVPVEAPLETTSDEPAQLPGLSLIVVLAAVGALVMAASRRR